LLRPHGHKGGGLRYYGIRPNPYIIVFIPPWSPLRKEGKTVSSLVLPVLKTYSCLFTELFSASTLNFFSLRECKKSLKTGRFWGSNSYYVFWKMAKICKLSLDLAQNLNKSCTKLTIFFWNFFFEKTFFFGHFLGQNFDDFCTHVRRVKKIKFTFYCC
jgi:hypothetical protein